MWYWICPFCGCALDPEEKCDCQQAAEEQRKADERRARIEQLRISLEKDAEQKARKIDKGRYLRLEEVREDLLRSIQTTVKTA